MHKLEEFFVSQKETIPNAEYLPSYKILQLTIMKGIEQGVWKQGELLPPERKLAAACGMSVGTVKRAMLELVHQGVLLRRQGSGTYVASPSFARQHRRYYLFLENFKGVESKNSVQFRSIKLVAPDEKINKALALDPKQELFKLSRVFSEDGVKCVLSQSYLSAARFFDLDKITPSRFEMVPLFILLEDDYGAPTKRTEELLSAITAGPEEAAELDLEPGSPMLHIRAVVYGSGNTPFEYRVSYCVTGNKSLFRQF